MEQGKEKVKGDAGKVALMGFTKSKQVQAFASGKANKKKKAELTQHLPPHHPGTFQVLCETWPSVELGTQGHSVCVSLFNGC